MVYENRMSREERAKQFMPFAALKGYPEALREKERAHAYVPRPEFSEAYMEELERRLYASEQGKTVTIVYYCDGAYREVSGTVRVTDRGAGLFTVGGTVISVKDVCSISGKTTEGVMQGFDF